MPSDDPVDYSLGVQHDGLYFLPLGGTGEIGMNLNLYHHAGRWLAVDCGVMFGRTEHTQFALHPDASFIAQRRDALDGLVITHAHQDHVGAVRDLWPQLRCPVYATRFTVEMLRSNLREVGLHGKVPLRVIEDDARFSVGPFRLQRVPMTHSTVEMAGLVIRTEAGTVFHTGDFKLDPDPVEGRTTDERTLRALGDEDVLACISDSTNAHEEGWTRSEGEVVAGLREVLAAAEQRVAVALFSSNVARVRSLMMLAHELEREVVLLGRSLERTVGSARAAGYLQDLPSPVEAREYGFLPRERVLLLCTGSQGEPRAGLTRLAEDSRRDVYLEEGDTVLFSARKIPGNELFVERVQRMLGERGIHVVTAADAFVHTSGHPRRGELRTLYDWVRPRAVVPVHGTPMHLTAHAELAREMGLQSYEIRNGHILRLAPGPMGVVGSVPVGRVRREERGRGAKRG